MVGLVEPVALHFSHQLDTLAQWLMFSAVLQLHSGKRNLAPGTASGLFVLFFLLKWLQDSLSFVGLWYLTKAANGPRALCSALPNASS